MSGKPDVSKPSSASKSLGRRRAKSSKAVSRKAMAKPAKAHSHAARKAKALAHENSLESESGDQEQALEQWIELFPHGISIGSTVGRPVLILKDKSGTEILPVWMHTLDAGVALAELSHSAVGTPHAVTRRLLESLGLKLESCSFIDLVGHHQFVNLTLRGEDQVKTFRVRADEAMSFCLQGQARFFGTRSFMARCRSLDVDLSKLEQNLVHGQLPQLTAEIEISSKKHPYVM